MRVGNFEVDVWDAYPVFVVLKFNDHVEIRFPHTEISDLEYAIKWAKREAKLKLGKDAHEVEL